MEGEAGADAQAGAGVNTGVDAGVNAGSQRFFARVLLTRSRRRSRYGAVVSA